MYQVLFEKFDMDIVVEGTEGGQTVLIIHRDVSFVWKSGVQNSKILTRYMLVVPLQGYNLAQPVSKTTTNY